MHDIPVRSTTGPPTAGKHNHQKRVSKETIMSFLDLKTRFVSRDSTASTESSGLPDFGDDLDTIPFDQVEAPVYTWDAGSNVVDDSGCRVAVSWWGWSGASPAVVFDRDRDQD